MCILLVTYLFRVTHCGDVSENGPHGLMAIGAIRRCGLGVGRVSLAVNFEVTEAQARPRSLSLSVTCHLGIELSANLL